jgi:hypothetical protein
LSLCWKKSLDRSSSYVEATPSTPVLVVSDDMMLH